MRFCLRWRSVCVASTHSHSLDADAERDRAECAVGAGMAVAADQGHAGQREAELGSDDMDDAVAPVAAAECR